MKKIILMVDDDVDMIEMYKPVLEKAGYQFFAAYNSTEGLELSSLQLLPYSHL